MKEEEKRERRPWQPTEPAWLSPEERGKSHRYRLPEQVKEKQAGEIRQRFAKYTNVTAGQKKKQKTGLVRVLVFAVLAYAVWRYLKK